MQDFNKLMMLDKQKRSDPGYSIRERDALSNPAKYKKGLKKPKKIKFKLKPAKMPVIEQVPYAEFLKTKYWMYVKNKVLIRDNGACTKCGSSEHLQVHHKTYLHHFAEHKNLHELTTLCRDCHKIEHKII